MKPPLGPPSGLGKRGAQVQDALLEWYSRQGRDLPWRRTQDPYAILLSEVMLQQTQVERVIPKYEEFLRRFPDFAALAAARAAEVIRAWAPLGYNQRAVRLWRLARRVVAEHEGRLPQNPKALRELEGVGEYTAAAVGCFAFAWEAPVIDTNVRRVLGRLFWGLRPPPARELALAAVSLLPEGRASPWNQAVMDLGAMVCRSRRPRCSACPARAHCRAAPLLDGRAAAIAEERTGYKAAPFRGSARYYRGQILGRLRALAEGERISTLELGRQLKAGFAGEDLPWLEGLVAGLEKDGLARSWPGPDGGTLVALP